MLERRILGRGSILNPITRSLLHQLERLTGETMVPQVLSLRKEMAIDQS